MPLTYDAASREAVFSIFLASARAVVVFMPGFASWRVAALEVVSS